MYFNFRFINRRKLQNDKFKNLVHLKAFRSLVEPGEAVGLLASQVRNWKCKQFIDDGG